MKDKDFLELIELRKADNGFVPVNEAAMETLLSTKPYESLFVTITNERDLKFHRCYFKLLNIIYFNLPDNFKKAVPEKHFYNFIKTICGQAKVVYEFKQLPALVEYESISFGNMNQKKFEAFVRDQLSIIYAELLPKLDCEYLIDEIEENFKKFLTKIEV